MPSSWHIACLLTETASVLNDAITRNKKFRLEHAFEPFERIEPLERFDGFEELDSS
jgi:hypothetical protein